MRRVIESYIGMQLAPDSLARFHLFVMNRTRDGNILDYDCLMQRSEP